MLIQLSIALHGLKGPRASFSKKIIQRLNNFAKKLKTYKIIRTSLKIANIYIHFKKTKKILVLSKVE